MQTIDILDLATVRGGADEGGGAWDSVKSGASSTWNAVKDFTGGFATGSTGGRNDAQYWGDSSSTASKIGGSMGNAFGMTGRGKLPKPR